MTCWLSYWHHTSNITPFTIVSIPVSVGYMTKKKQSVTTVGHWYEFQPGLPVKFYFVSFAVTLDFSTCLEGEGERRDIQMVAWAFKGYILCFSDFLLPLLMFLCWMFNVSKMLGLQHAKNTPFVMLPPRLPCYDIKLFTHAHKQLSVL